MNLVSPGRWFSLSIFMLLVVMVPFLLYDQAITAWTHEFLRSEQAAWVIAGGLGGLLASDILLPVPSSLVGTAAGYLLGMGTGTLVTWTGMTAGCGIGYLLGARLGRGVTRKWVGDEELQRVSRAQERYGDWVLIILRSVPVLAEVSVVVAGIAGMPLPRFLTLTMLSNFGIALMYALIGAYSFELNSFVAAFGGAVAVPALALLFARQMRM